MTAQMQRPKKVAIIGAGPSGLVMAKTLLHNFPEGTFSPTIFDKWRKIGGLWSVDRPSVSREHRSLHQSRGLVDPFMHTNLSRFSVAFSDLAWESVVGEGAEVPMFPRAWQVGKYLEKYVERYLSKGNILRLGQRVVGTDRQEVMESGGRWVVRWTPEKCVSLELRGLNMGLIHLRFCSEDGGNQSCAQKVIESEGFDFLVVASGHFGSPYIPKIAGLEDFSDKVIHSSELQNKEDVTNLMEKSRAKRGKLVVIGGSMSGVEAASALALHLSHLRFANNDSEPGEKFEVDHVCSRPAWVIPTYLPHRYAKDHSQARSVPFLPLDLVLYDLGRRGHGKVEFGFGPVTPEQVSRVNEYFFSLLGSDYGSVGSAGIVGNGRRESKQPSWVTIGDDYAEQVRFGSVKNFTGRVCAVHYNFESDLAGVEIDTPGGQIICLNDVAGIVMATGFSPSESLSFLPRNVLETLEVSKTDRFLPLILDGRGSSNAQIPDLGFVGFYRGAFWGPMEMQAQYLADTWARTDLEQEISYQPEVLKQKARERQRVRDFRSTDHDAFRGQFPMGDYVGLMESFARDLGIHRASLTALDGKPGPVIPARYEFGSHCGECKNGERKGEIHTTMSALKQTLLPDFSLPPMGTAAAVFRALHGRWRFSRENSKINDHQDQIICVSGTAIFHPRYPSSPKYGREYVLEEAEGDTKPSRYIYGLCDDTLTPPNGAHVVVWSVDLNKSHTTASELLHQISVMLAHQDPNDERTGAGQYIVRGVDVIEPGPNGQTRREYIFHLDGVAISKWECAVTRHVPSTGDENTDDAKELIRTVYER